MKITERQVNAIWREASKRFGFTIINTTSLWSILKNIPAYLAVRGFAKQLGWDLSSRYFVIGIKSKVFVFTPGEPGDKGTDEERIRSVCLLAHELMHVFDLRKDGATAFMLRYAQNASDRAVYEARAAAAYADVYYAAYNVTLGADVMITDDWMSRYMLSPSRIEDGWRVYRSLMGNHDDGHYATSVGYWVANKIKKLK